MAARHKRSAGFRLSAICAGVAACFQAAPAWANPTGAQIIAGQAALTAQGPLLNVTNAPGTVINWQGFSIGAGETTRFLQQNAQSAVLNRVVTPDPSVILGNLVSNGRVFLINPAGILVGAGARIDVAGFVASTINLTNEDFAAGRLRFQPIPNAASVVNAGVITTPEGGQVYLVAPTVINSGTIITPRGETVLAAGNQVELIDTATPGVRVQVDVPGGEAHNLGRIVADSGRIGIVGALVKNSGQLSADQVVGDGQGRIFLKASRSATLAAGSTTSASGQDGGSVEVRAGVDGDADAATTVAGTIDVSGHAGKGGTVTLLAPHVALVGDASIQASGASGGGAVLVGGDYQGRNAEVPNAKTTYMAANATVNADATEHGNGGKVIAWSDEATGVYGRISARGGAQGGNGGFVEVSSHRYLDFSGIVNTSAPRGAAGMLLLDPEDLEIEDTTEDFAGGSFSNGVFSGANPTSSSTKIRSSTLLTQLASGNVTITTTNANNNSGNIKINHDVALNTSNSFTLLAENDLTVRAEVSNSGTGGIKLMSGWNGISTSAPSASGGTGTLAINSGGSVSTTSGELSLTAATGMSFSGSGNVLKTTGGNITLQVSGASGVSLADTASIDAGSGLLSITAGSGALKVSGSTASVSLSSTRSALGVSLDKLDVSNGALTVNGIASVDTVNVRGASATFNSDATISTLSVSSGTLKGAGTSGVTTTSSLTWSGGTVLGKLTLDKDKTGALSGSKTLGSSTIASRFTNKGTITDTASSSSSITLNSTSGASTVFDNQGTYSAASSGSYSISNGGQGGSVLNSGTFDVANGSYSIALPMTNSGTLKVGTGSLSTGTLTNSGLVTLSGSSATDALTVNGNLNLTSTSTIKSSVANATATGYGHIGVTGAADLQGKVQFLANNYSPNVGDTFHVVSYGSRTSNQFSKVVTLFPSTLTATTYDATRTSASISNSTTGGVNTWLTFGDGSWTTSSNWSFGHLPTSTEDAEIDAAIGTAVLSSGNQSVRSLGSDANLTVSGGSLDLASTSKIGGTLTVSGGTVQGAGNLTVKNLTLSSGTVGGTGTLTVSDSYSRSGGTVASTLTGLTVTQASGNLAPGVLSIPGPVSLTASSGNLSLDSISASTIFGKASGSVTINSGATLSASATGDALTLVDGSSFVNNAGASALSATNGRWLVYSQNPSQDTRGGLAYGFKQYGASYNGSAYNGPGSGNGFLYTVSPTLTATLTGTVEKTYDGSTTATLSSSNFATSGLIDGDSASYSTSGATYSDKNAGSGKTVTATVALAGAANGGASVYGYQFSSASLSGAVGKIDPATLSLTGLVAANKVYDATTAAAISGGTLSGVVSGDTVTFSATGSFGDANVGIAKPVTLASVTLGGSGASNYTLTQPSTSLAADITVRPLATWIGTASGLWSDSANWDHGVVPVGANVLAASLPGASSLKVTYDKAAGNTTLKSLDSTQPLLLNGGALTLGTAATDVSTFATGATLEVQAGGALSTVGQLKTASYVQSGGTVSGTGSLLVNGAFTQTGGTIALIGSGTAAITQADGNLALGALTAPGVTLKAQSGAISQSGALVASQLDAQATGGISLGNSGNRVSTLTASNSGTGDIAFVNGVPLTISGITNSGGDITVDNTGAVTTVGAVSAPAGAVIILAHSPLAIGSGGVDAGGNITLGAGQTAGSDDDLTLSGKVASSGSGSSVTLSAGDNVVQNAAVTTNGGDVSASAESGSISMGLGASTTTGGGNASYAAPNGDIVLTRIDAGAGGITLSAGGSTLSATGYSGANLVAAKATITAGGNAMLTTQVQSLQSKVAGTFAITDATTGQVVAGGSGSKVAAPVKSTEQAVVATLKTSATTSGLTSAAAKAGSTETTATTTSAVTTGTSGTSTTTLPTKTDPNGTIGGGDDEFGGSGQAESNSSGSEQKNTAKASNKESETKNASKKLAICR